MFFRFVVNLKCSTYSYFSKYFLIFIDTIKIILYKKWCGWDSRLFRCHLVFPMPNKLQFLRQMEHGWYYHLSYDLSWLYKGSLIFGIVRNTENNLKAPKEQTIPRLLGFLKRKFYYRDFARKITIMEVNKCSLVNLKFAKPQFVIFLDTIIPIIENLL